MRMYRYVALIGLFAFAINVTAQAGPPAQVGGPPPSGGGIGQSSRFDDLNKAVGLSPDQRVKVKAIMQGSEDSVHALQQSMPTWNDEAKTAIDKIWAKERSLVIEVLNSEQKPNTRHTSTDGCMSGRRTIASRASNWSLSGA